MNELDTLDNLGIGQLALIYRMQLETKRMSEMMEVGKTYFARELLDMMDCSLTLIHFYCDELVKHNLVEKNLIQHKGYKQAVFKRLAGEYHTMDFNAKVSMIRNRREKVVVMPELPSNLLLMMGYTEFKPKISGRQYTIEQLAKFASKASFKVERSFGNSMAMMEMV